MRALIRFGKEPRLRFISHLDLQRFFQRAVNRTGLPIAWSQGFNPHPVMSFGSALALGWTSEYEVIDIKLSAPMGRGRVEAAVKGALPEDLPVLEVRMIDDKHPAPMAQVRMSDYRIILDGDSAGRVVEAIPEFLGRDSVMAVKKSKSGEKEIDIRPLAIALKQTDVGIFCRLMLTEQNTLKPDLLVKALSDIAGFEPPEARIHRLTLLGEGDNGEILPLMKL